MKTKTLMIVLALTLLPSAALSQEVVFGAMPLPPFVIDQETGSDVEIVRAVCKRMGVEPTIQILPFIRLLDYLKKGEIDGNFPVYYTKEREAFLCYSPEPHNVRRMVVLARKDSKAAINKLSDLVGKTIAVVSGYAYGAEFDKHPDLIKEACKTDEELLTMLVKGRRDFAATEETVAIYTSKRLGFQDQIKIVYVLSQDPLYVAFSKAAGPQSKTLAEKFGATLRHLKEEGIVQKILEQYQSFSRY